MSKDLTKRHFGNDKGFLRVYDYIMTDMHKVDPVAEFTRQTPLDLRLVMALAGERDLNAREQQIVDKLQQERGEGLFSDMLYALTRKSFPSRQAKLLWGEIGDHRKKLEGILSRTPV